MASGFVVQCAVCGNIAPARDENEARQKKEMHQFATRHKTWWTRRQQ